MKPRRAWLENVKTVVFAVMLALGVRVGIAQAYEIEGPSMEPTLREGERVVALRCAYGLSVPFVRDQIVSWSTPVPGDVVIVESPADGEDLVKRVLAVEGDVLEVRDGHAIRNGVPLANGDDSGCDPARFREPPPASCVVRGESLGARRFTTSQSRPGDFVDFPPTRVPAGQLFVVGDHRDQSNDSRFFGVLPVTRVRGRVLFLDR